MIDFLLNTKFLQCQHATDTQQNFLLQTVLPITTIKGVGDGLIELRVHFVVGIKQIELDATHVDYPNIGMNLIVGIGNVDHHRITLSIQHSLDGQRVEVLGLVLGNLLSFHRQALCEIAETIEEAHSHHIDV